MLKSSSRPIACEATLENQSHPEQTSARASRARESFLEVTYYARAVKTALSDLSSVVANVWDSPTSRPLAKQETVLARRERTGASIVPLPLPLPGSDGFAHDKVINAVSNDTEADIEMMDRRRQAPTSNTGVTIVCDSDLLGAGSDGLIRFIGYIDRTLQFVPFSLLPLGRLH